MGANQTIKKTQTQVKLQTQSPEVITQYIGNWIRKLQIVRHRFTNMLLETKCVLKSHALTEAKTLVPIQ